MKQTDTNYWNTENAKGFHQMQNSQDITIQPLVAQLITRLAPSSFLDFGCGDGFVDTLLPTNMAKTLYDINLQYLNPALASHHCQIVSDFAHLVPGSYDCILASFVLLTIKTATEYRDLIKSLASLRKQNGALIVVDTHPCFRQYAFRYLRSRTTDLPQGYFSEGLPYHTELEDLQGHIVAFEDYHYNLSFMINQMAQNDWYLRELHELPDRSLDDKEATKRVAPYIIAVFR